MPGERYDEGVGVFRRTIAGQTRRSVEWLRWSDFINDPVEDMLYLDCASRLDNTPGFSLTFAAKTGNNVAVAGGVGANFTADDIGRFIFVRYASGKDRWQCTLYARGVAEIVGRAADNAITVKIHKAMPALAVASGAWRLSVTTISGLEDFEGETLTIQGDGMLMGEGVVADGKITGLPPAGIVQVGYNYETVWSSMPLDGGGQSALGSGRKQRVVEATVRVLRSIGGRIEASGGGSLPVGMDSANRAPLMPPVPFSGERRVKLGGGNGTSPTVTIRQDKPLPWAVAMFVPNIYAPWVQP